MLFAVVELQMQSRSRQVWVKDVIETLFILWNHEDRFCQTYPIADRVCKSGTLVATLWREQVRVNGVLTGEQLMNGLRRGCND